MKAKLTMAEALATKTALAFRIQAVENQLKILVDARVITPFFKEDYELKCSLEEQIEVLKSAQKKLFYFTSVESL